MELSGDCGCGHDPHKKYHFFLKKMQKNLVVPKKSVIFVTEKETKITHKKQENMSIWADIYDRSTGEDKRKEDITRGFLKVYTDDWKDEGITFEGVEIDINKHLELIKSIKGNTDGVFPFTDPFKNEIDYLTNNGVVASWWAE